jgi:alginate O-acetyltransferase complex protein AlgI
MIFTSVNFVIFLSVVFLLYWFVFNKTFRIQNLLLLVSSYFFYASWDYRFLALLVFSTFLDYYTGRKIDLATSSRARKFWLSLSIIVNVGFLGVFKYFNFFIASFAEAVSQLGISVDSWTLQIILPVGISFYTFHGISYIVDIYYGRIKHESNFVDYAVFVSFFPLLVAGPIERATHLLPQIVKPRKFDFSQSINGLRLILWGMFKKIVIADSLSPIVDEVFGSYSTQNGGTLALGAIYFAVQIYCDFSGYSDIAIGTGKLFNIELLSNFRFPYFSKNIAEFWRRWHISLSSWFRDYVFIPLGGSRGGKLLTIRNIFVVFLLSGLWHGANWTFVVWGFIHAVLYIPGILFGDGRKNEPQSSSPVVSFLQIIATFMCVTLAWVFFRSDTIRDSIAYLTRMFTDFSLPDLKVGLIYCLVLLVCDIILRHDERLTTQRIIPKFALRFAVYITAALAVLFKYFYFSADNNPFIYFQF